MSKILLVEDNEMNRDMLSRRLIKKGFELVMAMDGEQAARDGPLRSPRPHPYGYQLTGSGRLGSHPAA